MASIDVVDVDGAGGSASSAPAEPPQTFPSQFRRTILVVVPQSLQGSLSATTKILRACGCTCQRSAQMYHYACTYVIFFYRASTHVRAKMVATDGSYSSRYHSSLFNHCLQPVFPIVFPNTIPDCISRPYPDYVPDCVSDRFPGGQYVPDLFPDLFS